MLGTRRSHSHRPPEAPCVEESPHCSNDQNNLTSGQVLHMSRISAKRFKVIQSHMYTTEVRDIERLVLILLCNINIVAVHSSMQVVNGNKKRREGKQSENSHLGAGWRTVPGSCRPRERNAVSEGSGGPPLQNRLPPGGTLLRRGPTPSGYSCPLPEHISTCLNREGPFIPREGSSLSTTPCWLERQPHTLARELHPTS